MKLGWYNKQINEIVCPLIAFIFTNGLELIW